MCREREMQACRIVSGTSLVIMTWNNTWYFFLKTSCFDFSAHSRFWDRSQWRNHGELAKAPLAKSFENLTLKYERLNVF